MDVIEERIKNDYNIINSKLKQLENEYFEPSGEKDGIRTIEIHGGNQ